MRELRPVTVEITEIPVGSARESVSFINYKNFIESLVIDDSAEEKQKAKQILADAEILMANISLKCKLVFQSAEQLNTLLADPANFEKTFKLTHTIATSNMNCFNAEGIMTKYVNPEDILTEYCTLRLHYYDKRKLYQLNQWTAEILQIKEKIRFITYVIDETHELKGKGQKKCVIEALLEKYQFVKFGSGASHKADADADADTEGDTDMDVSVLDLSYDYLLNMPFYYQTKEKLEQLKKKLDDLTVKMEQLKGRPSRPYGWMT